MLLYENGRFHSGPISFALPEGFYLDSAPLELFPDGLTFYSPDCSLRLQLSTEEDRRDAYQEQEVFLKTIRKERILQALTPIHQPLSGCEVIYRDSRNPEQSIYEAVFDYDSYGVHYNFIFSITGSVPNAQTHPVVQGVFNSIRLVPQEG